MCGMKTPNTEHIAHGGIRRVYSFNNGYGASVVRHQYSYGGEDGLWELAVLHGHGIDYTTPITRDVIGHLTDAEVDALLARIAALSANGGAR